MKYSLLAGAGALALGFASPAMAGNVILTGHDDDYHCAVGDVNACNQIGAMTAFARNGSALPVLVIDQAAELSGSLTGLGVPIVTRTPGAVVAGDFNNTLYSAFAVASVTSCGGCDNPTGTGTLLAGFSAAIASFFNAGGGIIGMTAANDPNGFAYVPQAAAGAAIGHSSGFAATAAGLTIPGFAAVNGDETHNVFTSYAGYQVAEVDTTTPTHDTPVTIFVRNGTISGGTIGAPEPISLSLLGVGLFGLGMARRFRRR